jgi:hypothetical protein
MAHRAGHTGGGTSGGTGGGGERLRGIDSFEREADEFDDSAQNSAEETDLDLEAPEADAAEQHVELLQQRDEPITERPADRDGEANPADTAEQRRVVGLDEEDYR